MKEIIIGDFKKVEIKIGEIISAEVIPGSEKLIKLLVNFNEEKPRQILSGIKKHVTPESLTGLKCSFITNLPAREMMGLTSDGMILAAETPDGQFTLLKVDPNIPAGTKVG